MTKPVTTANEAELVRLLTGSPMAWGRWGPDDEIGALNYLDAKQVRRGLAAARDGRTYTLGMPVGAPSGDLPLDAARRRHEIRR